VHRLDRETSGLMVFARTPEAEQHLIKQFSKHTVHRVYQAIALGRVEARTIESFLVRDRGDGLRGSTAKPDEGQRAVTHVRPIENLEGYTVVECQLETGRTHQIRIHLSEAGHMLCGERMYDQVLVEKRKVADPSGAPRVALHARELGFVHPRTGEELSFKSPWPKDLEMLLQRLRQGENSLTKNEAEGSAPRPRKDSRP
jgi:23S rRNA pseudouridine1911/1915/1917 synthase